MDAVVSTRVSDARCLLESQWKRERRSFPRDDEWRNASASVRRSRLEPD